jgi:hypothetical protein
LRTTAHFSIGQAAGRLVECDDARAAGKCFRDFDHLPLGERQRPSFVLGFASPTKVELLAGGGQKLAPVYEAHALREVAQKKIFRDRHLGNEMQLLVNDSDSAPSASDVLSKTRGLSSITIEPEVGDTRRSGF